MGRNFKTHCPACKAPARSLSTGYLRDTRDYYRKLACTNAECAARFVEVTLEDGTVEIRKRVSMSRYPDRVPRLAGIMSRPYDDRWGSED